MPCPNTFDINWFLKWTLPIQNWNTAIAHFMIKFEDRINLN
ncbi:hypothetical protein [Spiroplasma endosymbiont of Danaus chrysippus]|nr:hypothetical protein [Spiroplasma endosymbiont of Danaus chrysippus]